MPVLVGKRGDEFRASPEGVSVGAQKISALTGGGFVTTWYQDGEGVLAQRFDAASVAAGPSILVNPDTIHAYVAALASGGFVVVSRPDYENEIYARIYDASGKPLGANFEVTDGAPDFAHFNVLALPGGGFVVTWIVYRGFDNPDAVDIRAQIFTADGAPAGSVIEVNDVVTGTQDSPAGIGLTGGGFVLMWTDYEPAEDDSDVAVRGQLFSSDGTSVGANFLVNTDTTSAQSSPDVAALPGGGFVATWQSYEPDPKDPEFGIGSSQARIQIFDASGAKVGGELLASTPGHDVSPPSITALPWGGFMVAWDDYDILANDVAHRAQLFGPDGNKIGDQFDVNSVPTDYNGRIELTTLASGDVAAAWTNVNYEVDRADVGLKVQILIMPTVGTSGNDTLTGTGEDRIAALAGDDVVNAGGGADIVDGGTGIDKVKGGSGNDILVGGAGDDMLAGGDNDDFLFGGIGSDALWGGAEGANLGRADGVDTVDYSEVAGAIAVTLAGTDANPTIKVAEGVQPTSAIDNLVSIERILGTGMADSLTVKSFGATLAGRLDYVDLGGGKDTANFSALAAVTLDLRDPADDIVTIAGSRLVLKNVEVFVGTAGADKILGSSGLDGVSVKAGAGDDVAQIVAVGGFPQLELDLDLGTGNDHLMVDFSGTFNQVSMEEASVPGGTDGLNVTIILNSWSPAITALGVNRVTIKSGVGNDFLRGSDGADRLESGGGWDWINAGAGNDFLDGGGDADNMQGGTGSDTYVVDTFSGAAGAPKDVVTEAANAGTDTVRSSVAYTLPANVENLVLTGTNGIAGTGNSEANRITGNAAANSLKGASNDDTLNGLGGIDDLDGGSGNDRLDGGTSGDTMAGGLGHDTYLVDHLGDKVIENGSSGSDTVETSIDFALPVHFEKLIITGTAGRTVRGNAGDNSITGNSGANTINGGSGNDVIDAGGGNDLVYGHNGNDSLKGGAGLDRFLFNTALGTSNVDKILDFSVPNDTINLNRAIFTKAGANGTLAPTAFRQGTAAGDSSDRIIYDQATGKMFYDADGIGGTAQVLFATVTAGTALTNADFVVYG